MTRGCETHFSSDDLGDVWAREMARYDKEIGADEYRYRANPEAWFVRYFATRLNITEEKAMKLKDFFGALVKPFADAFSNFKAAKESKDLPKTVEAIGGIVEVAAKSMETTANAIKTAGGTITGAQKKEIVRNSVVALVTGTANKAIDIPLLNEDQEEFLFSSIVGGIVDILIDQTVARLNEKGWNL